MYAVVCYLCLRVPGEWSGNLKSGYGIQVYGAGHKYEGEWSAGKREGHGVYWIKGDGDGDSKKLRRVYAGNWKNDKKHVS